MTKKFSLIKKIIISSTSVLTTMFFSCNDNPLDKKSFISADSLANIRSMNDYGYPNDSLEKIILEKGDVDTYDILMIQLLDYNDEERIRVSKIMADKHHYVRAYTDVFEHITMGSGTFNNLATADKDTALKYLNLALKQNDSLALELKKEYNIQ